MTIALARIVLERPRFGDKDCIEARKVLELLAEAEEYYTPRQILDSAVCRHSCKPCRGTGTVPCKECGGSGNSTRVRSIGDLTEDDLAFVLEAE